MTPDVPLADPLAEGQRLLQATEARGLPMRLIGGVAIRLRSPVAVPAFFVRTYQDLDVATAPNRARDLSRLLSEVGYEPAARFNALHGDRRMIFHDRETVRQLDVFVGDFRMCHLIPLRERLLVDPLTVPLAELLLTKLQIVELNPKDLVDIWTLVWSHPVGDDDGESINARQVAALTGRDWGLWRTVTANMQTVRARLAATPLNAADQTPIGDRLDHLANAIDAGPKSLAWRTRSAVGERVRWYDEPDEVGEAAQR